MRVVMYSPWPNKSFVPDLTRYAAAAGARTDHKARDVAKTYEVRTRAQALDDLANGDRLYIVGHGVQWEELIKADSDTPWQPGYANMGYRQHGKHAVPALDPKGLVALLDTARLPVGLSDIRLWTCKGGDTDFTRFALLFTGWIKKRNKSAQVSAYKGYMVLRRTEGRKRGQMDQETMESEPAKNLRVLINEHSNYIQLESLNAFDA